jgi:sulfite reductase alpha subunit-like flavoprotein
VLSLNKFQDGGLFVAFSRDQPQRVYVQHKIKEQGARVWNLLYSGAAVYIAGSSTKMPADVTAALEEVTICQESGETKEGASKCMAQDTRKGWKI